jgi:acyl-CoA synthetase (NDP forming)
MPSGARTFSSCLIRIADMPLTDRDREALRALFEPRSVAIVGASRTPGKLGHTVVSYLKRGGFAGAIYPINPAGGDIEGVESLRAVADMPEGVDCAMLVVPAGAAVQALRECAERGVKTAIIGASGFAEDATDAGRQRQVELLAIARAHGMRLLGPNTNGLYNKSAALSLGYNSSHGENMPLGPVTVISHSGALFGGIARSLTKLGVGLAKFVPVGNEADLDMLDMVEYCLDDDATKVIGLVIEALSDGERLAQLAVAAAERGKPIVAVKIGRSAVGVGAALAHSSRLAGSARAYDALFAACGIAGVRSVEGLAAGCAVLALREPRARETDSRIVGVTTSGAGGALLADFAAERGMRFAGDAKGDWTGRAGAAIAKLPSRGHVRNPIDVGATESWDIGNIFAEIEQDSLNGPTVAYLHIGPADAMDQALLGALVARKARTGAPIVALAPGGLTEGLERQYREHGIILFQDSAQCFEALAAHFATTGAPARLATRGGASPGCRLAADAIRRAPRGTALTESESAAILRGAGIALVESREVRDLEAARAAARALGYPVVLKAIAPGVAHKNKFGFVMVGLDDDAALTSAYAEMVRRIAAQGFDAAKVPLLVQPMARGKLELIVGLSCEARLGHFLVLGLGGVQTELFDEVVLLPVIGDLAAARERIAASRIGRVITHEAPAVFDAVMKTLGILQEIALAAGDGLESLDLNPMIVTKDGGLLAVDALVVTGGN